MPYFIEADNPDCAGWATVKQDGEVMGCHATKQDAIDQMIALSLEEGIDPGGERAAGDPVGMIVDIDGTLLTFEGDPIRQVVDYANQFEGKLFIVTARVVDGDATKNVLNDLLEHDFTLFMKPDRDLDSYEWKMGVAEELLQSWDIVEAIDDDPEMRSGYSRLQIPVSAPNEIGRSVGTRQIDLTVPEYIRAAATRGLELRSEGYGGDGLTEGTIREARAMAAGDISEDKVIRANAWGARHAVDLDATKNSNTDDDNFPGAGAVAHYLWGINPLDPEPARKWFERKSEQIKAERGTTMMATIVREKDNVVRQIDFAVEQNNDGLTLDGYGAVFDQWTEIEDNYGVYRERIAPGAFKRTLGMRMPILQFDHGTHPLIGSLPLGRITSLSEDAHGLRVKARLSDNWLVQPVRDAIRDGGITGMSFRFRIVNENWDRALDGMEERTISEVELYEVGPVVFPAYEQTSVGVRSRAALTALQDAEIRDEIARILACGTDIASLATTEHISDPNEVHSEKDSPTERHLSLPTKTQRRARIMLAGISGD